MALFSIEIADDHIDRVVNALCENYQYRTQVSNPDFNPELETEEGYDPSTNPQTIDNPETQAEFANRMVREFLINNTQAYEIQQLKINAVNNVADSPIISDPSV